jgi:hypothetical protein
MLALVAEGVGDQQHQHRAQALAAGADDVFGDLVDQRHLRIQRRRMTALTASMSARIGCMMVCCEAFCTAADKAEPVENGYSRDYTTTRRAHAKDHVRPRGR